MADSDMTQQVNYREAYEKLTAEVNALIAIIQQRRTEREAIAANIQAEAAAREAQKKAKAEAKASFENIRAEAAAREASFENNQRALAREANHIPFLTTTQWLGVAGLAVSLQALFTPRC